MDANALLKRILASDTDKKGILDSFGENTDLHQKCMMAFVENPYFIALKGLFSNPEITGFDQAIRNRSFLAQTRRMTTSRKVCASWTAT